MRPRPFTYFVLALACCLTASARRPCFGQQVTGDDAPRDVGTLKMKEPKSIVGWAVLIGAKSPPGARKLKYCENDVLILGDALLRSGVYDKSRVYFLGDGETDFNGDEFYGLKLPDKANCGRKADLAGIEATLAEVMAKTSTGDSLFIAFSGHGDLDEKGESFLLPLAGNSTSTTPNERSLPVRRIIERLCDRKVCKASRKFLVLDSCHSGGGTSFGAPGVATETNAEEDFMTDRHGTGTLLITSCAAEEVSMEYGKGTTTTLRQGVFSYFLANALRGDAEADLDADGSVTAVEAFIYTRENVQKLVSEKSPNFKQSPQWRLLEGNASFQIATAGEFGGSGGKSNIEIQAFAPASGAWWFTETPLLVPRIRDAMDRRHVTTKFVGSAVVERNLQEVAGTLIGPTPRTDALVALKRLQDPASSGEDRDRKAKAYEDVIKKLVESQTEVPTDLHLLAILYGQTQKADLAAATFDRALKEYARPPWTPTRSGLLSLCHADYAETLVTLRRYAAATDQFNLALNKLAENAPPVFRVYCLCGLAGAHREFGEWTTAEALLQEAEVLADKVSDKRLQAFVFERSAWLQMDRWNVVKARVKFENALKLREMQAASDVSNDAAALQDRHGQLAADRLAGMVSLHDLDNNYKRLRADIRTRIEEFPADSPLCEKEKLFLRLVNTCERAADVHVFACNFAKLRAAPSDDLRRRLRTATTQLNDALDTLQKKLPESELDETLPRLYFKLAIAQALRGNKANAAQSIEQGIEAAGRVLPKGQGDLLKAFQELAQAIVGILDPMIPEAQTESVRSAKTHTLEDRQVTLRNAIRRHGDEKRRKSIKRDELELLLFASGLLVASNADIDGKFLSLNPTVKSDVKVFTVIANDLNESPQMRRFLRPYFNSAIRSTMKSLVSDYGLAADLILNCKYGKDCTYEASEPVFIFHKDDDEVFALFSSGDEWTKIVCSILFDDPKGAAVKSDLLAILSKLDAASQIQLFWRDSELNIADEQFPSFPNFQFLLLPKKKS